MKGKLSVRLEKISLYGDEFMDFIHRPKSKILKILKN
jgi:hypothetical protein